MSAHTYRCSLIAATRADLAARRTVGPRASTTLLLLGDDLLIERLAIVVDRVLVVVVDHNLDLLLARGFVVGVVELAHVRMLQRLLGRDALAGIEGQAATQEIDRLLGGMGVHLLQRPRLTRRQALEHRGGKRRLNGLNVLGRRATSDLDDAVELVHGAGAGEHGLATEELTKNAANRPHIDALGVPGYTNIRLLCEYQSGHQWWWWWWQQRAYLVEPSKISGARYQRVAT